MISAIAVLAFCIYFTLAGFGKVAVSKNADANAKFLAKYGKFFKVGGVILIALGVIGFF